MGAEKRRRVEAPAEGQAIADCGALLEQLKSVYGELPEDFLWGVDKFQTLILPRIGGTGENVSNGYTYIGRARARPLYERVCQLRRGNTLLILGAKGSGKSTVMASVAAFLLIKHKKRVVYFSADEFCHAPADVLRDALLVAAGADEQVAGLATVEELKLWCHSQRTVSDEERLLFVVDDWDKLENYRPEESQLVSITRYHILVKLSSSTSRDRHLIDASDKPPLSFEFDGPYSEEELLTWICQSTIAADKLKDLDCLTGGMPRLLRLYEEAGGVAKRFRELIEHKYTQKLYEKLVKPQTSAAQLAALVQLVTAGVRGAALASPVDFSCFYKDQRNKLTPLSPFLRSRLEFYIMEHAASLEVALSLREWSDAVRMDCIVKGRNPARVGWNVEGLTIAVMRCQGKLWGELDFKYVRTYEHGCEATEVASLSEEEMRAGVLVVPVAFNEQALDVMYLRLREQTLEVKPVQITVAAWKHKKRKRPHVVWQEKVLPRWLAEEYVVKHQFVYLMPKTLTKEELGEVEADLLRYVEQCRAAIPSTESDDDDTETEAEVYDETSTSLGEVESEALLFKCFADVHPCLKEFDKKLRLAEPCEPPKVKPLKQCAGSVVQPDGTSVPCERCCRTDNPSWHCCPAHKPAVEASV